MFDDILGGDEPAPDRPRRGRPTNEERRRRAEELIASQEHQRQLRRASAGETAISPEDFRTMIVGRNWLGKAFEMDPDRTVKKRIAHVKPYATVSGRDLYQLREIIPYLLKPRMDIATYLRTLNPHELPSSINKSFWEAERIKNDVLIKTGEAWETGDVLRVLGEVFMLIKERIPIMTEGMRGAGLTDEQSAMLQGYCDQMQADLYEALMEMPKRRETRARVALMEDYAVEDAGEDELE